MAVAEELRASGAAVSWLGTRERIEAELVPAAGFEIDFLRVRGIDRRNPLRAARAGFAALGAVAAARAALRRRGADAVLGGGGYVAGPAGLAAVMTRTPLVLSEADSHLGLANRLLAGQARRVCLAFPIAGREGGRYLVTGRPVPRAVLTADRRAARERFGIEERSAVLLVMGGSQGARSLNEAAVAAFAEDEGEGAGGRSGEARREGEAAGGSESGRDGRGGRESGRGGRGFDVIHLAGRRDYPALRERLAAASHRERYTLLSYEPDLGDVLAASDLVVARSGGSIFEMTAAGRPSVLVPYPHATGDHQGANARWLERAGAATVIADAELTPARLADEVAALLGDEAQLSKMAAAARGMARPDAARRIAEEVLAAARSSLVNHRVTSDERGGGEVGG